eukprot:Gb_34837 [translate_table: standard]
MYCTEAESSFRLCPNKRSRSCYSLDLFGPVGRSCETSYGETRGEPSQSSHNSHCSSKGSHQSVQLMSANPLGCCKSQYAFTELNQSWKKPKTSQRLQEEDLIGRLDECVSDANSDYSTVDCTLSLGTPASRLTSTKRTITGIQPLNSSLMSRAQVMIDHLPTANRFVENNGRSGSVLHSKWNSSSSPASSSISAWLPLDSYRGTFTNACKESTLGRDYGSIFKQHNNSNGRLLYKSGRINGSENAASVGRKCANCDTTTTPLWRNGPKGPKSLCNACGIRYKKEERRTAATVMMTSHDYQTKKSMRNDDDDRVENSNYNDIVRSTDDMSRENSCLTWQGSVSSILMASKMQLQRPLKPDFIHESSLNNIIQNENIVKPNSATGSNIVQESEAVGGPLLLLGLSVDSALNPQKQRNTTHGCTIT